MVGFTAFLELFVTLIVGAYFYIKLKNESVVEKNSKEEYKQEAEKMNRLRRIHLNEPLTEMQRPEIIGDIVGQEEGIRALRSALWGKNPQNVIIYGPPGVGKTAAARVILEDVKNSPMTPFMKDAPFIEVDATTMRCDEYGFTDPLIGSVHDPIYQGSGACGQNGIPEPKPGAVTRAHGGVLFIDEIGELQMMQLNKLLKVLEDRRVMLESSYFSSSNKKIPPYIRDAFINGFPADFRLIGATTEPPEKIPAALRSRCTEIYFKPISRLDIIEILKNASCRCGIYMEMGVKETIADFSRNGREAIKLLQFSQNLAKMEGHGAITVSDVKWAAQSGRYKKRIDSEIIETDKIIDISLMKPFG